MTTSENLFSPQIQIFEPFAAHVDPSRTNMSSKQILQTVTSRMNDIPFILNKSYKEFTEITSPFSKRAPSDGIILYNANDILCILYKNPDGSDRVAIEYAPKVKRITNNALVLRYLRPVGAFHKGDLIVDYSGQTLEGIPRIGLRTKVMFASFLGYCAEDAFACSESFSRKAQIDYSEKLYIPITKKFKYLPKEDGSYFTKLGKRTGKNFMNFIKIDSSMDLESETLNLSDSPASLYYQNIIEGLEDAEVTSVKVHKLNPKKFSEVAKEYVYSPKLIQEISYIYKDQYNVYKDMVSKFKNFMPDSTEIKNGKQVVVSRSETLVNHIMTNFFSNAKLPARLQEDVASQYNLLPKDIDYILEVDLLQTVPSCLGDKFANCFAGKGVISLIIPDKFMPKGVDIIFNPLGIYGRNNWGMMFEVGLAGIVLNVEETISDRDLTYQKLDFINERFIRRTDLEYYDKVSDLLYSIRTNPDGAVWTNLSKSIKEIGLFLCADNFPSFPYDEFFKELIAPYSEKFGTQIVKEDYTISKELQKWLIEEKNFTSPTFDVNNLKDINTKAFIGDIYYLKLFHTADSKYNSVSLARIYNAASGQPTRGRKTGGGCHVSWQSLAAGFGHTAGSNIVKELWSLKSDSTAEKDAFLQEMVFTGEYNLREKYSSRTMDNLNHSLALFGVEFKYTGDAEEASMETEAIRVQEEQIKLTKFSSLLNKPVTEIQSVLKTKNDEFDHMAELDILQKQAKEQEDINSMIEGGYRIEEDSDIK